MNWVTGVVVYALIWWTVLFAVLPFGAHPADAEVTPGGWRGAPANPKILRKAVITTILATVLWMTAYVLIATDWISFRVSVQSMPDN